MQYGSFTYGGVEYGGQQTPIVVPAPPAGKHFTLFIAGVDQSSFMLINTLNFTQPMGQTATCNFELWDAAGLYRPTMGQDIQVFSNTTKIFGGTIEEMNETAHQALKGYKFQVKCTDYSGILDKRTVGKWYQGQFLTGLTTIASDIVNTFLSADGITYDSRDGDPGISLGDQLFNWITARQAFNQLASLTGWDFHVDYNKALRFFPKSTGVGVAPFNIADNDGNWLAESMSVRTFRGLYRNREFLRSSSQASPLWQDIFSAAIPGPYPSNKQSPGGGRIFFVTLYILEAVPIVKVNGTAMVVIPLSQVAGAAANSWDWYYIPGGYGVAQNQGAGATAQNRPLLSTDILEVDYQTRISPVTVVTCAAQIAARATAEGNSGIYDAVDDAPNLTEPTAITAYANGLLNRYGCTNGIPTQVTYRTIKDGLFAATLQTINTTHPLVASASYLLTQISGREVDKDHIEYTATADIGSYQGTYSAQFFAQLIARGQMPQPANRQTYTWLLAPTTFNVANPGITSTGTFPFPHVCQNQEEICQYLSVTVGSGPATNAVTIQLLINNSGTVLSVTVPKGATSNSEFRSYVAPSQTPLKIFAADILQVFIGGNSDAAMKDVNVTLVTSVVVT